MTDRAKPIEALARSPKTALPWTLNSLRHRREQLLFCVRQHERMGRGDGAGAPIPEASLYLADIYREAAGVLGKAITEFEPFIEDGKRIWPIQILILDQINV